MSERWTTSDDEECWCTSDEFPTREEAIAFGREEHEGYRFWVGRIKSYVASGVGESVADALLERLSLDAYEHAGDEASERWPSHSMWPGRGPDGGRLPLGPIPAELARRCQEVVDWYLAQDPPTFWELECVEEIRAADEEGE